MLAVAVDPREPDSAVEDFVRRNGLGYPVVRSSTFGQQYGMRFLPSVAVVRSDNRILFKGSPRDLRASDIEGWLASAQGAIPAPAPGAAATPATDANSGMMIVYALLACGVVLGLVAGGLFLRGKLGGGANNQPPQGPVIASSYPMNYSAPQQPPPYPSQGAALGVYPAPGQPPQPAAGPGYGRPAGNTAFRIPGQPPAGTYPAQPAQSSPQGPYQGQPQSIPLPPLAQPAPPPTPTAPPPEHAPQYANPRGGKRQTAMVPKPITSAFARPPQVTMPAPPPQQTPSSVQLEVDAEGYVLCPSCTVRTRANRSSCMNCGTKLPPIKK